LLLYAGLFLIPFALLVFLLGRSEQISESSTQLVIVANLVWVLGSFWLLLGAVQANLFGVVFIVAQALAVGFFAILQIRGLRTLRG
jgi:hypothetical protein